MYREIRRRSDLSSDCKILFCMIAGYCRMKHGGCTASNATLAEEMGATPEELEKKSAQRNIQRWLGKLEAKGFVRISHVDDNPHKARTVVITGRYDIPVAPDGGPDKGCDKKQREYDTADARVRHQTRTGCDTADAQTELLAEKLKEKRTEAAAPPAPAARPVVSLSEREEQKEPIVVNLPEKPTPQDLRREIGRCGLQAVTDRVYEGWREASREGTCLGLRGIEWNGLRTWLQTWGHRI